MLSDALHDGVCNIEYYEEEEEKTGMNFGYKNKAEQIRKVKLEMLILELVVGGELPPDFDFDSLRTSAIANADWKPAHKFSEVFNECVGEMCGTNQQKFLEHCYE